jgi:hypothetical protein
MSKKEVKGRGRTKSVSRRVTKKHPKTVKTRKIRAVSANISRVNSRGNIVKTSKQRRKKRASKIRKKAKRKKQIVKRHRKLRKKKIGKKRSSKRKHAGGKTSKVRKSKLSRKVKTSKFPLWKKVVSIAVLILILLAIIFIIANIFFATQFTNYAIIFLGAVSTSFVSITSLCVQTWTKFLSLPLLWKIATASVVLLIIVIIVLLFARKPRKKIKRGKLKKVKLKPVEDEILHPEKYKMLNKGTRQVTIKLKANETEIDALHKYISQSKGVTYMDIEKKFKVPRALVEEWTRILEEHKLITIVYPTFGSPKLTTYKSKEENREVNNETST